MASPLPLLLLAAAGAFALTRKPSNGGPAPAPPPREPGKAPPPVTDWIVSPVPAPTSAADAKTREDGITNVLKAASASGRQLLIAFPLRRASAPSSPALPTGAEVLGYGVAQRIAQEGAERAYYVRLTSIGQLAGGKAGELAAKVDDLPTLGTDYRITNAHLASISEVEDLSAEPPRTTADEGEGGRRSGSGGGTDGGPTGRPEEPETTPPVETSTSYGPDPILPVALPQYTGRLTPKSQPKDWPGMWANLGAFGANGGAHKGVDFSTVAGTPLIAIADGKITNVTREGDPANKNTLGGTTASMEFEYDGRKWSAYYAHMRDLYVKRGDLVKMGQEIGTVGNTGNARTTGPHCHFEVKIDGAYVDPLKVLKPAVGR